MITCTLTPVEFPLRTDIKFYTVSGVGKTPFWPHDGDTISENDIPYIERTKGWRFVYNELPPVQTQ